MATRMQQRRSPSSEWAAANPILAAGEIGFETDTSKFKIGDGTNHWSDLSYFENSLTLGGSFDDYILLSEKNAANGIASLDADGKLTASQIPNIDEISQDAVNSALAAGTGITKTYNDADNIIILAVDSTIATKTYADGKASDAQTAAQTFATNADSSLHTTIAGEIATSKSQAISTSEGYTDTAISSEVTNRNSAITTARSEAISTAATDATSKVAAEATVRNSAISTAKSEAITTSEEYTDTAISTEVTNRNSAIATAKSQAILTAESYTDTAITNLVNAAPSTLDTLKEIADAIAADESTAAALATTVGTKLSSATAAATYAPIASPTFTGTVAGITKSMVGLGNVDNTSDANKPVSTATQTVLDTKLASTTAASTYETITNVALKAPLASPALTGTPTAPTATTGTNTTQISTTAFVKTAIDAITTTGVTEGTNKYFTDQRAVDAIVYSINHGLNVTLDGGTL